MPWSSRRWTASESRDTCGSASSSRRLEDPFRTACPGPAAADVIGSSEALALGSLPAERSWPQASPADRPLRTWPLRGGQLCRLSQQRPDPRDPLVRVRAGTGPRPCSRANREAAPANRNDYRRRLRCTGPPRHRPATGPTVRPSASSPRSCFGVSAPARTSRSRRSPFVFAATCRPVPRRSGHGLRDPGTLRFLGTVIWQPPPTGTIDVDTLQRSRPGPNTTSRSISRATGSCRRAAIEGARRRPTSALCPMGRRPQRRSAPMPRSPAPTSRCRCTLRAASYPGGRLAIAARHALRRSVAERHRRANWPSRVVDVATVVHGRTGSRSLASSSDFAVHGLAGTVTSTVQLRLGRPRRQRRSEHGGSSSSQPNPVRRDRVPRPARPGASLIHTTAIRPHAPPWARAGPTARLPCECTARRERCAIASPSRRAAPAPRPSCRARAAQARKSAWDPDHRRSSSARPLTTSDVTQGANTCRDSGRRPRRARRCPGSGDL